MMLGRHDARKTEGHEDKSGRDNITGHDDKKTGHQDRKTGAAKTGVGLYEDRKIPRQEYMKSGVHGDKKTWVQKDKSTWRQE